MISHWKETKSLVPLKKIRIAANGLLLLFILTHSFLRDVALEKQFSGDLRNRVVGARLQKDGRLPYFYFWQNQDGIRYFDPNNANRSASGISNITASPFFHQLMYPICDLNQQTISWIWMVFQYTMLATMILVACGMTNDTNTKWMMLNIGILFTTTEAWKSLILTGQNYFFLAFLVICIIRGILSNRKSGSLIAGILMAAWILNRPIGLIALPPLLFFYKPRKVFFIATLISLSLYGLFVLSSAFEKALWKNYVLGMQEQVQVHQAVDSATKVKVQIAVPKITRMEGIDLEQAGRYAHANPIMVYSENGNFFVIYRELFDKKISLPALYIISLLINGGLMILFYFCYKKRKLHLVQVLLFAFILYMVVEIMSPVYRHQYYSTQWFPLLLTALLITGNRKQLPFLLLVLGLFLQIVNFHWLPMRHTLGEGIWLITLLLISVSTAHLQEKNLPIYSGKGSE